MTDNINRALEIVELLEEMKDEYCQLYYFPDGKKWIISIINNGGIYTLAESENVLECLRIANKKGWKV